MGLCAEQPVTLIINCSRVKEEPFPFVDLSSLNTDKGMKTVWITILDTGESTHTPGITCKVATKSGPI